MTQAVCKDSATVTVNDEVVVLDAAADSIYAPYSPSRRLQVVLTVGIGYLLTFCATPIYTPCLKMLEDDLHTGSELVAATVSISAAMSGLGQVVWGPASDRFGRLPTYAAACVGFIGSCLGCLFAPNIQLLLLFRALQGGTAAAFLCIGPAVIADITPPEGRGLATGWASIGLAAGLLVAPLLGGGVCHVFRWRSTFVALAIMCFVFGLALLLLLRTETHQYLVLQRMEKADPSAAARIAERDEILSAPPKFEPPWMPFRHIVDRKLLPHTLLVTFMYGVVVCFGLEVLPRALALPPYNLATQLIGVAMLADAVPTLLATPLGGFISDKFATQGAGVSSTSRLLPNTLLSLSAGVAVLGAGWSLQYTAHLGILLAIQAVAVFGMFAYMPAYMGCLTTIKQAVSASATAGVQASAAIAGAVILMMTAAVRNTLGYGWWFTIHGVLLLIVNALAYIAIVREQRAYKTKALMLPATAEGIGYAADSP